MGLPELREDTYVRLGGLMQENLGLGFATAKRTVVASRLATRLQRLGLDSYEAYVALIATADDGGEFQMAVDLLTTPENHFFRELMHFDLLESELSRVRPQRPRLWSASTSFGDEAYSLAMLLADLQQAGRVGADWLVLGTDINERRLRSAAEGLYPQAQLRQVTPERLRRYGLGGDPASTGLVQMQAGLRERVRFERHDLRAPLHGAQGFDAIWLRQVLVYFDAATRQTVLAQVLARLHPGGLFFVGTAEQGLVTTPGLDALAPGVFRKQV
ncbi:CheR family methyltransferase [Roseateles sp. P5_D6]